eukprot:UN02248
MMSFDYHNHRVANIFHTRSVVKNSDEGMVGVSEGGRKLILKVF